MHTTDKFRSEKLNWGFGSGELKKYQALAKFQVSTSLPNIIF